MMNDGTTGSKYESTKDLNRAEIAKLIRADIKAAVAAGTLPKAKYSVRVRSFAGGGSIDVTFSHVDEPGFVLFNAERIAFDVENPHEYTRLPLLSERAREIESTLEEIRTAYGYDRSDRMTDYFDVRYYGDSKVEWQWESEMRRAETERAKERLAASTSSTLPAPPVALDDLTSDALVVEATVTTPVVNDVRVDAQVDFLAFCGVES